MKTARAIRGRRRALRWLYALLALAGIGVSGSVAARVRCVGPACAHLPADDSRRQTSFLALQLQFQAIIRRDHLRAAIAANSLQGMGGAQLLQNQSLALGTSTAWTPGSGIAAGVPNGGVFYDLPVSGIAVAPSFSWGSNLQALVGQFREDAGAGLWPILHRMDSRLYYAETWTQDQDFIEHRDQSARGLVRSRGFDLRHLPVPAAAPGGTVRFLGVLVSAGIFGTRSALKMRDVPSRAGYIATDQGSLGQNFLWDTSPLVRAKASLLSVPFEVRSGVSLFDIVDTYAAAGAAHHQGSGRFSTVLSGPIYSGANLEGALSGDFLGASPNADALLAALLSGQTKLKRSLAFGKLGLELGSSRVRLNLEIVADQHARGFRIGGRYLW